MAIKQTESLTRDNLFSAANQVQPVVSIDVEVVSGAGALKRGTVLAAAEATPNVGPLGVLGSGTYTQPVCVLSADIDATSSAVSTVGYATGEFNRSELIVDGGANLDNFVYALSRIGIFAK